MAVETITTVLIPASLAGDGDGDGDGLPGASTASPYDLTDLATVRDELSITTNDTSNDAFLSRAITQASTAISNYCNRVFAVEAVQDQIFIQQDAYPFQVPGGVHALQLSRWPLVLSAPVGFTGNTHSSTVVDGITSPVGIIPGALVFASGIPAGTTVETVGTKSITLSQAATSTLTALSLTTGVQVIQTLSVGDTQTLVYGTDFTVDAARGWLIRLNSWTGISTTWEAEPVTVQYQGGYAAIPSDLVEACLRMVTARYRARGRDPLLVERTQGSALGSERFWVGNAPGQKGGMSPEIISIVNLYRVPVAF